MPSTYTTRNRLEKQEPGENSNTWGTRLNTNVIDLVDFAISGMASFALSGSKTLSTSDGAADEARAAYLNISGGTGGTVTLPDVEKVYHVRNASSGTATFTTGSGTTAAVAAGANAVIACEGGNVVRNLTAALGALSVTSLTASGAGSFGSLTVGGAAPMLKSLDMFAINGNLTLTPGHNARAGRVIGSTNRTWTIQAEASGTWPDGAFMIVFPSGGGTLTVARDTGVSMFHNGSNGNRTISATGFGILLRGSTDDEWFLIGSGIT